jgi:CheY-like chemotaxis protein
MYSIENPAKKESNILVVEDCKDSQEIFCEVLKKIGATTTCASNGEEGVNLALSALKNHKEFDVIVMDIQMPIMDGHSAARKLRESGYTLPIISMTARSGPNDVDESLAAGCNSHISKLSGMKGLLSAVEKEINKSRLSNFDMPVLPLVPQCLRDNPEYAALALSFLSTLEEKIQHLHESIQNEKYQDIIDLTYYLGNLSMYGYTQFSMIINQIQLAAENKNLENLKEKINSLDRSVKAIIAGIPQIKKIINEK